VPRTLKCLLDKWLPCRSQGIGHSLAMLGEDMRICTAPDEELWRMEILRAIKERGRDIATIEGDGSSQGERGIGEERVAASGAESEHDDLILGHSLSYKPIEAGRDVSELVGIGQILDVESNISKSP
jgi:hypothetical protein